MLKNDLPKKKRGNYRFRILGIVYFAVANSSAASLGWEI